MIYRNLLFLFTLFFLPVCYAADDIQEKEQRRLQADNAFANDFKQEIVHTRTLRTLITEERYSELEKLLEALELQYSNNSANEHAWILTYYKIRDLAKREGSEEALLVFFDRWIEATDSHIAHLARGSFLTGLAWFHRGGRTSSDTPSHKFASMDHYARLAKQSFLDSLNRDPKMLPAYIQLIALGRLTSDVEQEKSSYQTALRLAPSSYWLRWEYMSGLEPRWGGSMEAMFGYVESLHKVIDSNPRIWRLMGRPSAYEGGQFGRQKNYQNAIESYTQALEFSQHPVWLARRAFYHYRLQRYPEAVADLRKVAGYGRSADHAIHLIETIEQENTEGMKYGQGMAWYNFDIDIAR